jgi:hypothetical protein
MQQTLADCRVDSRESLLHLLKLNDGPFFTQNTHYYESARRKWLGHYQYIRRFHWRYYIKNKNNTEDECLVSRAPSRACSVLEDTPEDRAFQALSEMGYSHLRKEDLARLHPPDEFYEELTVMADVRAYFQVAYKVRFSFSHVSRSILTVANFQRRRELLTICLS